MTRFFAATWAGLVVVAVAFPAFAAGPVEKIHGKNAAESKDESDDKPTKAQPAVKLSESEQRLVKAVNAYRKKYDLEPLDVDPTLMGVARRAAPYFSHCIHGKWCWHRAHEAGFSGWATDDIASGYESPEDAVDGWSTSDGHARQMRGYFNMNGKWCNYKFNRIGVGISGRKYIAVFGREDVKR